MEAESCSECGATGRWASCSQLFMALLALDHERQQPWATYHAVNVACYLLQHPSQAKDSVLAGQWQVIDTFTSGGLGAVHTLTGRAVRGNNGRARHGPVIGGQPVPDAMDTPSTTIEDVSLDGTFPARGYQERMLLWANATVESRGASRNRRPGAIADRSGSGT